MSNNFSIKNKKDNQKISLDCGSVGKCYSIVCNNLTGDIALRLAEMGLVPNTVVQIVKKAPLGDPLEISLRGYSLCLRAKEARGFQVVEVRQ